MSNVAFASFTLVDVIWFKSDAVFIECSLYSFKGRTDASVDRQCNSKQRKIKAIQISDCINKQNTIEFKRCRLGLGSNHRERRGLCMECNTEDENLLVSFNKDAVKRAPLKRARS